MVQIKGYSPVSHCLVAKPSFIDLGQFSEHNHAHMTVRAGKRQSKRLSVGLEFTEKPVTCSESTNQKNSLSLKLVSSLRQDAKTTHRNWLMRRLDLFLDSVNDAINGRLE
jgi:hypothetical protein